ncbi:hypothetical protein PPERSA_09004 [Pseudocohnilembus persalinus]|uniref:Uncharacterized protein n=1 Tax=Pseudocohnilembus persalinus TaxID=266149 RepID=A0A0V0R310_PSEPJ|nr:hypothetical protein PPERSA_09004 [Pseudocohnilembus persalinus]|eukprot:KRX08900.1 hypothetical protein PPERSA_09004 [Pseudocohnilembus persalinus]
MGCGLGKTNNQNKCGTKQINESHIINENNNEKDLKILNKQESYKINYIKDKMEKPSKSTAFQSDLEIINQQGGESKLTQQLCNVNRQNENGDEKIVNMVSLQNNGQKYNIKDFFNSKESVLFPKLNRILDEEMYANIFENSEKEETINFYLESLQWESKIFEELEEQNQNYVDRNAINLELDKNQKFCDQNMEQKAQIQFMHSKILTQTNSNYNIKKKYEIQQDACLDLQKNQVQLPVDQEEQENKLFAENQDNNDTIKSQQFKQDVMDQKDFLSKKLILKKKLKNEFQKCQLDREGGININTKIQNEYLQLSLRDENFKNNSQIEFKKYLSWDIQSNQQKNENNENNLKEQKKNIAKKQQNVQIKSFLTSSEICQKELNEYKIILNQDSEKQIQVQQYQSQQEEQNYNIDQKYTMEDNRDWLNQKQILITEAKNQTNVYKKNKEAQNEFKILQSQQRKIQQQNQNCQNKNKISSSCKIQYNFDDFEQQEQVQHVEQEGILSTAYQSITNQNIYRNFQKQ